MTTQQGKDDEYLGRNLMANLPSLAERVTLIRQGKAATSADINDRNLAKSQVRNIAVRRPPLF